MSSTTEIAFSCPVCMALGRGPRPEPRFIVVAGEPVPLAWTCDTYKRAGSTGPARAAYLAQGHARTPCPVYAPLAREGRPVPLKTRSGARATDADVVAVMAAIRAAFPVVEWPKGSPLAPAESAPAEGTSKPAEGAKGSKGSSAGEYTLAGVLAALSRWESYSGKAGLGGRACRAAIDTLTAAKDHISTAAPTIVVGCTVRFKPGLVTEFEALKSPPEGLLSELASVEMVHGTLPAMLTVDSLAGATVNAYVGEPARFTQGKYAGMLNRPAMTGRYFSIRADALEWYEPAPSAPSAPSDPTPSDPTPSDPTPSDPTPSAPSAPSDPTPVVDLNE